MLNVIFNKRIIFLLVVVFLTSSLFHAQKAYSLVNEKENAISKKVTYKYDKHRGYGTWEGPIVEVIESYAEEKFYFFVRKSDDYKIQIYIICYADKWSFYKTAFYKGDKLYVTHLHREVLSNGRVVEHIGINFEYEEFVRLSNLEEYEFLLIGDRDAVLSLPGFYFKGFLNGMKNNRKTK